MAAGTLERRVEVVHQHPGKGRAFYASTLKTHKRRQFTIVEFIESDYRPPQFFLAPKTVSIGGSPFEAVFIEYQHKIYNFTYRMTGNPEDAADFTQATFLRAFRNAANNQPRVNKPDFKVKPWLYRIANNYCLDQLKHRKLKKWVSLEFLEEAEQIKAIASTTPDVEALEQEKRVLVHRVLEKLPPKYGASLVLREYQDMSCREIAEVLGITESAVKSLLYRSREAFRIVFAELDSEEASGRGGITGNHQVDRIEALRNDGLTDNQIAEELGVKKTTVKSYNGVLNRRRKVLQEA